MSKLRRTTSLELSSLFLCILISNPNPCWARTEIAKLTPNEPASGFGVAVDIDGNYIVVGAPLHNQRGSSIIFHFEQGAWVEHTRIENGFGLGLDAEFGRGVAIEGDLIAIGAPGSPTQGGFGFVGLFRLQGSDWVQEEKLVPSGSADFDRFGLSVSISGGRIAVGSLGSSPAGRVYVYPQIGGTWTEEAILTASDAAEGDAFGASVSFHGDAILVGAPRNDESGSEAGAAYVFRFDGSDWIEEDKLLSTAVTSIDVDKTLSTPATSFQLIGSAVAISGDYAILGSNADAAFVFRHDAGTWKEMAQLDTAESLPIMFGYRVALQDDVAIFGAIGNVIPRPGFLFKRYGTEWFELDLLEPSDDVALGPAVALDQLVAVVSGGGSVYVFSLAGDIPTVSAWGVVVLTGFLLVAGTLFLRRHRRVPTLASAARTGAIRAANRLENHRP